MPPSPVPDAVAQIDGLLDRMHDLARRSGCDAAAAAEIVEASAVDLVSALGEGSASAPADPVGWWANRVLSLAQRIAPEVVAPSGGGAGVLAKAQTERWLSDYLAAAPDLDRAVLLLVDSYGLPIATAAVAVDRSADRLLAVLRGARLRLLAAVEGAEPAAAPGHLEPVTLTAAASGEPVDRTATRHLARCADCRDAVETQVRARLLISGLVVRGPREEERAAILERVRERADVVRPTAVTPPVLTPRRPERTVSPVLVAAAVLVALVVGVVLGASVLG